MSQRSNSLGVSCLESGINEMVRIICHLGGINEPHAVILS